MDPAEKTSLLGSQFDSMQCSHLCLVSLVYVQFFDFSILVFLCLLPDLDTYGSVDPLGMFPLFLKMDPDIIAPK